MYKNAKPTYAKASVGEGGVEGTEFELCFERFSVVGTSCKKDCPTPKSNSPVTIGMTVNDWDYFGVSTQRYFPPSPGKFEINAEGIKGFGETYRHGCFLLTTSFFDINNKTVYLKLEQENAYINFWLQ